VGEGLAEALALVVDQRSGFGRRRSTGPDLANDRDRTRSREHQKDRFHGLKHQDHVVLPSTEVRCRDEDFPSDPDGHSEPYRQEHSARGLARSRFKNQIPTTATKALPHHLRK
jgi:hypothetical protein